MTGTSHPTRERLIDTMVTLLDGEDPEHITADQVLTISHISKGSLYHHFQDYEELLEAALIRRFSRNVDASVQLMFNLIADSSSREELLEGLKKLNSVQQDSARAPFRLERARAAGLTYSSPRFHEALGLEQQRLTDGFTDAIKEGQNKGWITQDVDPQAVAVLIQAYTLGRVVDDIAPNKVDPQAWVDLIMRVIDKTLTP